MTLQPPACSNVTLARERRDGTHTQRASVRQGITLEGSSPARVLHESETLGVTISPIERGVRCHQREEPRGRLWVSVGTSALRREGLDTYKLWVLTSLSRAAPMRRPQSKSTSKNEQPSNLSEWKRHAGCRQLGQSDRRRTQRT